MKDFLILHNKFDEYEVVHLRSDGVLYLLGVVFPIQNMALEYADFLNRKQKQQESQH